MHAHLARGQLLLRQGRYADAEAFFRDAIAAEPGNAYPYSELARCLLEQEGRKRDALGAIDRAIQLDPEASHHHALRSLVLGRLDRDAEALDAAGAAIALDPDDAFNYAVKANALAGLQRWAEAEEQCRQALAHDADNGFAANLLANVLRVQGKRGESELAAEKLLATDPENPHAHFNAGWTALQRHDHRAAEVHFREALRLDPDFEPARRGLLESFKARSAFYRAYLGYGFWMQRFTQKTQAFLVIGLLIAYNFGRRLLSALHPLAGLALLVVYLGFVLWVWLASGIGNFLVLLDPSARHALRDGERRTGLFTGGGFFLGIFVLALAAVWDSAPGLVFGATLALGAVPASLTFDNPSRKGRRVFGAIALLVYLIGLGVAAVEALRDAPDFARRSVSLLTLAGFAVAACTWLGNVPALRRDDSE